MSESITPDPGVSIGPTGVCRGYLWNPVGIHQCCLIVICWTVGCPIPAIPWRVWKGARYWSSWRKLHVCIVRVSGGVWKANPVIYFVWNKQVAGMTGSYVCLLLDLLLKNGDGDDCRSPTCANKNTFNLPRKHSARWFFLPLYLC